MKRLFLSFMNLTARVSHSFIAWFLRHSATSCFFWLMCSFKVSTLHIIMILYLWEISRLEISRYHQSVRSEIRLFFSFCEIFQPFLNLLFSAVSTTTPPEIREKKKNSLVPSHWSRNVEARLSLVERFIVMLRQLSYAIKNQRSKAPSRWLPCTERSYYRRWFFMA